MQQRRACLDKAENMMKELKPQFEHFLKVFCDSEYFKNIQTQQMASQGHQLALFTQKEIIPDALPSGIQSCD